MMSFVRVPPGSGMNTAITLRSGTLERFTRGEKATRSYRLTCIEKHDGSCVTQHATSCVVIYKRYLVIKNYVGCGHGIADAP